MDVSCTLPPIQKELEASTNIPNQVEMTMTNTKSTIGSTSPTKPGMLVEKIKKKVSHLCTKDKLTDLFFEYYLPASQVIAISQPFIWSKPGAYLSQFNILGYILIGVIFLALGLKLKTDDIKDALRSFHVFIVAIVSGLFITGLVVFGVTSQLPFDELGQESKESIFGPFEFKVGMLLYYSVPCTITAGIVLVAQAEGNLPMAGAVATVSNIIGCYTTPIMLKIFLSNAKGEFDIKATLIKLTFSILMPVIVGKLIQIIPKVPHYVAKAKRLVSVVTSTCLAIILWMKVAKGVEDKAFDGVKWQSLLILIGLVLMMCAINIAVNTLFSFCLCLRSPFIKVMLLMVSQKTLVMAVTLIQVLPDTLGEKGLVLVPCFVAHPTQIIVFSFVATYLKSHPFDFDCPEVMPKNVIRLCDWLNKGPSKKERELADSVIKNSTVLDVCVGNELSAVPPVTVQPSDTIVVNKNAGVV